MAMDITHSTSLAQALGTAKGRAVRTLPLMAPSVGLLFLWMIVPLVMTLYFSFQNYNLVDPTNNGFAGLENYTYLLTDPALWSALINTLVLLGSVLAITVGGGTLLAVLFNQPFFGRGVARVLVISPFFVMPTVAALMWKNLMMHPIYGVISGVLPADGFRRADRLLGMAALRAPDPAHRPAIHGS